MDDDEDCREGGGAQGDDALEGAESNGDFGFPPSLVDVLALYLVDDSELPRPLPGTTASGVQFVTSPTDSHQNDDFMVISQIWCRYVVYSSLANCMPRDRGMRDGQCWVSS